MKKIVKRFIAIGLICVSIISLCACGDGETSNNKKDEDNNDKKTQSASKDNVWYLGGNNIFAGDVDVKELFEDVDDTITPSNIYSKIEYTESMIYGSYALNNIEKDVVKIRKEIPFEEVAFSGGNTKVTTLPIAVYLGSENICSSSTNYHYSEFEEVKDNEVAVIEFATEEKRCQVICIYEIDGRNITFKQIKQTNSSEESFTYERTGIEFKYEFDIVGPYMTFKKGNNTISLLAYCFTENTDSDLSLTGYSLPDSPLIDELDYFAASDSWNYAVRRDGSYYDLSAYKITGDGIFTVYLSDTSFDGTTEKFVDQYAYIIQSSASSFFTDFSIILLDGEKEYYYTDDIMQREARILEDQGTDISQVTDDEIKEIAEKKADLYDDLYNEFQTHGINVTINRSTGEIAMDASVLFGGDSAVITEDGKALLNKFISAYTSIIYNEKYNGFVSKTMIEGHTAPLATSTYESGLPLSQERADNVKNYCLSAETGVDTSKLATTLEAVGMSNSKPVYDSNGEIDLAACRRVSFKFVVTVQ